LIKEGSPMKNRIPRSAIRAACAFAIVALIAIVLIAIAPISFSPPFGTWTRLSADPIVSPQGDKFESAGTFNPSVVKQDGKFVLLYRAQDRNGTSSLGYAASDDGVHFTRRPEPVLISEARHILSWLRHQRRRRAFHPTARTGPDFRSTL